MAYITHAKLEVVGSQALVGSSNFTAPGLTKNIELNIQVQSAREVVQLQEWFETHWNEAAEVTHAIVETIARHTHRYTPFDVYAKALQEYFRGHELTATEWDETRSKMFPGIDRYQQEAYRALMKIARQHGGAFLCDGVGLGKTFVGLMLIERLVLHEGKRVVLFAPKATKEGVWEPHLREWLPHIGGVGGHADFSNLAVFSHTDLGRKGDFPERFRRIAELVDIVVIDEAHHFRNPGTRGDDAEDVEPSHYYRLYDLLDNAKRAKTLFLLTATPTRSVSTARPAPYSRREDSSRARPRGVPRLALRGSICRSSFERIRVSVGAALAAVVGEAVRARVRRGCEVRGGRICGISVSSSRCGRSSGRWTVSTRKLSGRGTSKENAHVSEQEGMVASVETTRVATERGSVRRADGRTAGRGDQDRERDDSRRHERHGASHARGQSRRWPGPPATQASA